MPKRILFAQPPEWLQVLGLAFGVMGGFFIFSWWDYPLDGMAALFLRADMLGAPINEYYFFLDPWTFVLTPFYRALPGVPWYGFLISCYYALALRETWRMVPSENRNWLLALLPVILDNLLWPSFTRAAAWVGGLGALRIAQSNFRFDVRSALLLFGGLALRQDIVLFASAVLLGLHFLLNPSQAGFQRLFRLGLCVVMVFVGYHVVLMGPQRTPLQVVVLRHFFTSDMGLWRQLSPDASEADRLKLKALQYEFNVDRVGQDDNFMQKVQAGTIFLPPLRSEWDTFRGKFSRALDSICNDRLFGWVTFGALLILLWVLGGFRTSSLTQLLALPTLLIGIQILVKPESRAEGPLMLLFLLFTLLKPLTLPHRYRWSAFLMPVSILCLGLYFLIPPTWQRYRNAETNYTTRKLVWQTIESSFKGHFVLLEVGGMLLADLKPNHEPPFPVQNVYITYEMYFANDPSYHENLAKLTGEASLLSVWKFMVAGRDRIVLSDPERMKLKADYFRAVYGYQLEWETLPESKNIDTLPHKPVKNLSLYRITKFYPISVDGPTSP